MVEKELEIKVGQKISLDDFLSHLIKMHYERVDELSHFGQFSLSGGNLSIFLIDLIDPIRIEFFGCNIDALSLFDFKTSKKIKEISSIRISPNILILKDGSKIYPGDYVVHEDYGIGLFKHFSVKKTPQTINRYINLEYLNNDILYVPINQTEKLSLYIGVGRKRPRLSKLGSLTWRRSYKKTYENIIYLAKELLNIYAARELSRRKEYWINDEWDREIRCNFPFVETPDQIRAISQVYSDLKKNVPMDRLLAGDVGFGKTEVAIRAAAQTVANGYQVIMLVPTTVLAEQHFVTFRKRFEKLPVCIERMSRFIETKTQGSILEQVKNGNIDILIGTHRLLDEDIKLKNIGLYIIDEEQRFGVKQKERLKKIHTEINVLSLSATPIPRTLFMALSGIRDISQIRTSPSGRKEIKTNIAEFNNEIIKKYINREIKRRGQIYYLHNEVSTIEGKCHKLRQMFPDIRVEVAHGRISEERLVQIMGEFAEGRVQILVCSTIIENGLDIPNVNTLIVEGADKFGLSQLYQIRGRIGRSPKQAYALFLYGHKKITDNAIKRLKALVENVELGSGFNIALSDLEIRGGGNILGREQHGNMETVGLVLYSKLLKMAVDNYQTKGSID
jgi:transcription-repair coupling factor (superfamily II helicase)